MPVLDAIGPIFRLSSLTSFDVVTLLALVPFALIAGSFCTALVYRIPQGIPWAFGNFKGEDTQVISSKNSRCPACGTVLTARDLVPVFSWLLLRGKCRHCGAPIPPRYLYIELSMLGMFVLTWLFFGLSWEVALLYIALPFLLALFVIDLDHMILPDQLNAILFVIGVLQMAVLVMLGRGCTRAALYPGGSDICRVLLSAAVGYEQAPQERGDGAGGCEVFCGRRRVAWRHGAAGVFDARRGFGDYLWPLLETYTQARYVPVRPRFDYELFCALAPAAFIFALLNGIVSITSFLKFLYLPFIQLRLQYN